MWVTPEQLDELRFLLYTGIGYGLILLILINLPPDWGKPKVTTTERPCPIGKVPPSECPHCKEKP